jgi:hypothetical protein
VKKRLELNVLESKKKPRLMKSKSKVLSKTEKKLELRLKVHFETKNQTTIGPYPH